MPRGRKKSLTIIDNTKVPAPKYEWVPPPTFKTSLDKQKYWESESRKIREGFAGLTPPHYYMLQHCKIMGGTSRDIIRPYWRDTDDFIFESIWNDIKNEQNSNIVKRREVGLSTIGGVLGNWFSFVYPNGKSVFTSKDMGAIQSLFNDKIKTVRDSLPEEIRPDIERINDTKDSCYLKLQRNILVDGKVEPRYHEIVCRETSEKPSSVNNISGSRVKFGFIDEAPLHKRRDDLLRSLFPVFREGGRQTGFMLMGGTIEDSLTNEDISRYFSFIEKSEILSINTLFVPAWMGYKDEKNGLTCENGYSDEKLATELILKERERLDKMEDKSWLRAFIKNYPLSMEEIYSLGASGRWEPDVAEMVKKQKGEIIRLEKEEKIRVTNNRLVNMAGQVAKTINYGKNSEGGVFILEDPKPNVSYYVCVDGVMTGKKHGEENKGSWVASTVVKMFDPDGDSYSPVCIYTEKPETVESSYRTILNQSIFYNQYGGLKGIMPEANAGTTDHFATFLEKEGYIKWLMHRKDLSGKGNINTNKYGQHVTIDVRDWQMKRANEFLRKYVQNIKMKHLIDDMMKPETENADVLDSWLMWFVAIPIDFDQPVKVKPPPPKVLRQRIKLVNGKWTRVWE